MPSPGDLPDPRIEPMSPALQEDSLYTPELPGKPPSEILVPESGCGQQSLKVNEYAISME